MAQRNIDKIKQSGFEGQRKRSIKNVKPNISIDSETFGGNPFLMASSDSDTVFSDDVDDYLHYLTKKKFVISNCWWYNMGYDMGGIMKMLPKKNIRQIVKYSETTYKDFKINYIIGKVCKIKRVGGNASVHHDLAQYYDYVPLKILAKQTSYDKVDVEDIANINLKRLETDSDYRELIIDRCVIDAKITNELANAFTTYSNNVIPNNRYLSVASISKAYFLTNIKKNLNLPSRRIMGFGLQTVHGALIDLMKLGRFKRPVNIDMVSAYPYFMSLLYSCNGIWTTKPEYVPDTAYSFYKCIVDFYDDDISMLWYNHKNKGYHPNGIIETHLTQMEYEFLINKGFNVEILKASHLLKSKNHEKPFEYLVPDLFAKRQEAKDRGDDIELIYKLILNAATGAFINTVDVMDMCDRCDWEDNGSVCDNVYDSIDEKTGKKITQYFIPKSVTTSMYNPMFYTYITAGCRMALLDIIWKYRDRAISLNTDGAYLTSKIPIKNGTNLGDWKLKPYDEMVFAGKGRYWAYKNGELILDNSAFRGLPNVKKNLPIIIQQMEDNPKGLGVSLTHDRPQKLKECVRRDKIGDIGVWKPKTTNISYTLDRRVWDDEITCNSDLRDKQFDSRPFTISEITEM